MSASGMTVYADCGSRKNCDSTASIRSAALVALAASVTTLNPEATSSAAMSLARNWSGGVAQSMRAVSMFMPFFFPCNGPGSGGGR